MNFYSNRLSVISRLSFCLLVTLSSCQNDINSTNDTLKKESIIGTWKLLSGSIIEGKDTTITDYTINVELIKIINESHFAFMKHDLNEDSLKVFVSGGGRSIINGTTYTEYLDFCNYREWENNIFNFEFSVLNDTLITTGIEKIEALNINRLNIEKYIRLH